MNELLLGIDLGTSYLKAGLFNRNGDLLGLGREPMASAAPQPRYCEVQVADFWDGLGCAVRTALQQAGAAPDAVAGLSYGSQANSFLLLDEKFEPLTPLMLWPDERQTPINPELAELVAREEFLETVGHELLGPGMMQAKLFWVRANQPEIWSKARHALTIADYLTWRLTGRKVGDQGSCTLTALWDVGGCQWWDKAFELAKLDRGLFAQWLTPGAQVGPLTRSGAELLGLAPGSHFSVGSLDHHVAGLGAGVGSFADASESNGTVLAILRRQPAYTPRVGTVTGLGIAGGDWWSLAFTESGAGVFEAYRKQHAPDWSMEQLSKAAGEVEPGAEGLMMLAEGEGPTRQPVFIGATENHTPGHYTRAIFEAGAFESAELIDKLGSQPPVKTLSATGGGARSDVWLQIKADMLGITLARPACTEAACLGGAIIAAASESGSPSEAMHKMAKPGATLPPNAAVTQFYAAWRERHRAARNPFSGVN